MSLRQDATSEPVSEFHVFKYDLDPAEVSDAAKVAFFRMQN